MNSIGVAKNQNILFLQGPMGDFFKKMDFSFRKAGANTFKIGLNVGDWFFSNRYNYIPYRGSKEKWGNFIYDFLMGKKIDTIFLFGDCRHYQRVAIQKSKKLDIDIFVFEEGYIRPNFITMERYGVNDFSCIPRDQDFYEKLGISHYSEAEVLDAGAKHYRRVWSAAIYFLLMDLFWFRYPQYEHHTQYNFIVEAFFGVRNLFRKFKYTITERGLLEKLLEQKKSYYFVPLQTYNDFQILEHSHFSTVEEFIEVVIYSFAKAAPKETKLLIKHHPMDRGRKDYSQFIYLLSKRFNIEDRIISAFDLHLPTCLKNTIGTITINSTVGISSLYHQAPTIVLGNAIYDIEGLTCKDMSLDNFWNERKVPNRELFKKFRRYLIDQTQLNGSFYGRFPDKLNLVSAPV